MGPLSLVKLNCSSQALVSNSHIMRLPKKYKMQSTIIIYLHFIYSNFHSTCLAHAMTLFKIMILGWHYKILTTIHTFDHH